MKILIIHGPNLNLLGVWSAKNNQTVTLDKLNRHIRKYIRKKNIQVKILQTNNETKIVSYIQNNKNKIGAIIMVPGPWQYSAFVLSELLDLVEIPFITITYKVREHIELLNGFENLIDNNICRAFDNAIDILVKKFKL